MLVTGITKVSGVWLVFRSQLECSVHATRPSYLFLDWRVRSVTYEDDGGRAITHAATVMMEAVDTTGRSVYFYETTRHRVPPSCHLHSLRCENMKSHFCYAVLSYHLSVVAVVNVSSELFSPVLILVINFCFPLRNECLFIRHWTFVHLFSLLSKNESKLIKSTVYLPVCLSVCLCPPLITFEPLCTFSWNLVRR
jgi:hypothetical protein